MKCQKKEIVVADVDAIITVVVLEIYLEDVETIAYYSLY